MSDDELLVKYYWAVDDDDKAGAEVCFDGDRRTS